MEICPHNKCTGCYACVNVCPHHCISMTTDQFGELHPRIDERKCISCNLCAKTCPSNHAPSYHYPSKCYAAWITDKDKRCICASGGLGTILSEYVIRFKKGVVFGTAYDKDFIPVTTYTETAEGLERFKGSKYVQSVVGDYTFKQMREFLTEGRFVLYIATPCQIAAARNFLKKDYTNFVTVDLICHGVTPTSYFKEEIDYLVKKNKIEGLADIRFRGNDDNNYCLSLWDKIKGKKQNFNFCLSLWKLVGGVKMLCYRKPSTEDYFLSSFLLGISLRENCFSCQYAKPERVSDLTIGDFIGLGENTPFEHSTKNVSSVTTNTSKGEDFYKEVMDYMPELMSLERDYRERLAYKPSLVKPFGRHPLNEDFRALYPQYGFVKAIRIVLRNTIRKNRVKRRLSGWTYIYRIPRKLFRIITKRSDITEYEQLSNKTDYTKRAQTH